MTTGSDRTTRLPAAAAVLFILTILPHPGPAETWGHRTSDTAQILAAAEGAFRAMKARDYPAIWASLSETSRKTILEETHRTIVGKGIKAVTPEDLRRQFRDGGPIARGYWNGFFRRFDPDTALDRSRWEMGAVGQDWAEVRLTYEKSKRPALLKVVREEGAWKLGLVETFWGRPE